ncbi:unnamed protein product [Ostreobium quekettii]|uniref:Protein kinase domain-containing protein n=1 Tax=Ostreobium quekettii TaxID=121088 RepID=A0A8S1IKC9_9CHLO|nr:unnamed protein product [Ostreobium quekettii]
MLAFLEDHISTITSVEELCSIGTRYNHKTMEFLVEQMVAAKRLMEGVTEVPVDAQDLSWWANLKEVLKRAKHLLEEHTRAFDIRHFYKVASVVGEVEALCQDIAGVLDCLGLEEAHTSIKITATPSSVDKDKAFLEWYLQCVIEGETIVMEDSLRAELEILRIENEQRSERMHLIPESKIILGQPLGKGGYAQVLKGRWAGMDVAVKRLAGSTDKFPYDAVAEFLTEAEINMNMRHPNVVVCYAATKSLCLVMELAAGSLQKLCVQPERLSWDCKAKLLLQASEGLNRVHSKGIVHRDVKSLNFLVFGTCPADYVVKVSDFGLAIVKTETTRSVTGLPKVQSWYSKVQSWYSKVQSWYSKVQSCGWHLSCTRAGLTQ